MHLLKSSSVSKTSLGWGLPYWPVCHQSLSSFPQEPEGWALEGESENRTTDEGSKCEPWQLKKAKDFFGSGHRKTYLVKRHRKPNVDLIFNSGFSSPVIIKDRQTWFWLFLDMLKGLITKLSVPRICLHYFSRRQSNKTQEWIFKISGDMEGWIYLLALRRVFTQVTNKPNFNWWVDIWPNGLLKWVALSYCPFAGLTLLWKFILHMLYNLRTFLLKINQEMLQS